MNKNNEVVFGHWQDVVVQQRINEWMHVANTYYESFDLKVARFGDNMRNVAVTEGYRNNLQSNQI